MALLAVLLAGLGAFQYLTLQRTLVDTRASALEADYNAALRSGSFPILNVQQPSPGQTPTPAQQRRLIDLSALQRAFCTTAGLGTPRTALTLGNVADTFAARLHTISGRNVSAIVYDHKLDVVGHNLDVSLDDVPRVDSTALKTALAGRISSPEIVDSPSGAQLAVAVPLRGSVAGASRVCGVAQLSSSTQSIDDVLARERVLLLVGGGAVLLLALLLGLLLTNRALLPLRRLTATSRALAGGDLRARSRLDPRRDEVGTLAHSFDDMADRIEAAFIAQAESEARMRRFIADASHELRTPVTALKGYIDVLRRGASREPRALDAALDSMAREAERMRILVLDLLTLARLDAQRPLSLQALDLNDVLAAVLDDGAPGMPEDLQREFAPGQLVVTADQNALATIARNLLVNACKYAPSARQVWTTARADSRAVFSVHDEGPGIAAADLPHVFDRFYRGEKTRAREEGGSGLGLSIARGLARAQGGDVAIESVEGGGTTVTVWLPLTEVARDQPLAA